MDDQTLNVPVRLIEMLSRTVYELGVSNNWEITSRDLPVTQQFNAWADDNDMNPYGPPTIVINQVKQSEIKLTVIHVLCVSVVSRSDHRRLIVSNNQQNYQIDNVVPVAAPGIGSPGIGSPGIGSPAVELPAVDVANLAETSPAASTITFPGMST